MNRFKDFLKGLTEPLPEDEALQQGNFTPRTQEVIALSRQEAGRLGHGFVGTEHLLLGLIKLGRGVSANVLEQMGLNLESVRREIERQIPKGPREPNATTFIPFTPRARKVITLAQAEAKSLHHTYIGTEHILLGILRENEGVAAKVLQSLNVELEKVRVAVMSELDPRFRPTNPGENSSTVATETSHSAPETKPGFIDRSQRFDVYCAEQMGAMVVYRNAKFIGTKKLFPNQRYDFMYEYIELEQADGKVIFLAKTSVIKFCEPGVVPGSDATGLDPNKKPE